MTQQSVPENAPGTELFPRFADLHAMVADEVAGLSDAQLDWLSDRWGWSKWSIRQQAGHLSIAVTGWLTERWGGQLFPEGTSQLGEMARHTQSPRGQWLDEDLYPDISNILEKVGQSMRFAQHVVDGHSVADMRRLEIPRPDTPPHWKLFATAHPTGVRWDPSDPRLTYMTLEATFRHLYFEIITHLYNIQRLKRAQGLSAAVEVPKEGYWVLPEWDRSEP